MPKIVVFWILLLIPSITMSGELAPKPDRFHECRTLGDAVNEVRECFFAVGETVEREMVDAYLGARNALEAFDHEHALKSDHFTSTLLQETQIAFEQYRKLHCQFPERVSLGGTGAINVTLACRVDLTLLRILHLREYASIK
ncbi:hypothetical protein GCM10008927_12790 [Amylibacter ulvae]|uniref:Lysozyme inhibitor LprI-like N-terminal domain-containing protein n=1 Tax=Paramylibacter ulvae TaxID=1651968 RepID=A0ABQ3CZW2_9RHOB|nr:lysozyme inhibitor LprI family protein [Amylibacter ulvae]GHA49071.1 hypothetical protein GCM10008927_12790 [Amylibacter ulvae]